MLFLRLFSLNKGFSNDKIPIYVIILGILFVLVLAFYSFKNGINFTKMKSLLGLLGLAIINILPIFWSDVPAGNEVFYFFFFGNLGYLIIYLIMANGIKKNCVEFLAVTMSYLALILATQCFYTVFVLRNTVESFFDLWYFLGWGLCNEAGALMCMCIPFIFYLIAKSKDYSAIFGQLLKLFITLVGILATTSRASYLIGLVIFICLAISLLFLSTNKKAYRNIFIFSVFLSITLFIIYRKELIEIFSLMIEKVFKLGLSTNGRYDFWVLGFNKWNESLLFRIFGPGICSILTVGNTAIGDQVVPLVFHSTFVQTLCMGGIIGIIFLGIHFFEKYKTLFHFDKLFLVVMGIGYFLVDVYGMLDNTYHMYYYMIPLVIILAATDKLDS